MIELFVDTSSKAWVVLLLCLPVPVIATACASTGSSGDYVSETYDFRAVESVYVETPVEIRLRTGGGGDTRALETTVTEALREHMRRELGWLSAPSRQEADLVASFRLTDWEEGADGTRVGGAVTLEDARTADVILSASAVHPNRYGAGGVGRPIENLPGLFDELFAALPSPR